MPGHDIIVIGASAGGVEALSQLARHLPADMPAAIFVVLHVPAHGTSWLPNILNRHGPLPARHPADGESIQPGRIVIAPPDQHLLAGAGPGPAVAGPAGERPSAGGGPAVPLGGAGRSALGSSAWCSPARWTTGPPGWRRSSERGGVADRAGPRGGPVSQHAPQRAGGRGDRPPPAGGRDRRAAGPPRTRADRTRREDGPMPDDIRRGETGSRPSTWRPSRTRIGPASRRASAAPTAAGRSGSSRTGN